MSTEKDEYPLVSALMIVRRPRVKRLLRAIDCFKAQTYPYKELIIINNARTQFEASELNIEAQSDVFMVDTPSELVTGQARNYAISAANGQILAQFDMDCWHSPERLEAQIATMANNSAHICVLSKCLQYSFNSGRGSYWTNSKDAILNTMVFSRPANIDYPQVEKNEELGLLNRLLQAGLNVIAMDKPELVCKFHFSDSPTYSLETSTLSKGHEKVVKKAIKTHKD